MPRHVLHPVLMVSLMALATTVVSDLEASFARVSGTGQESGIDWNNHTRKEFIAEWHRRGYPASPGRWTGDKVQIHHIQPIEYGGTNDFWNLVPPDPATHNDFSACWRQFRE
jgi:hypothetical protein